MSDQRRHDELAKTNYDRVAKSGGSNRRQERSRYRETAAFLDAFVGDAMRVLELGCGTGIAAIERAISEGEARGATLLLQTHLALHATTGWT